MNQANHNMGHAIASLQATLSVAQSNEPIYRKLGDVAQADLCAEVANGCCAAISALGAHKGTE